MDSPIRIGIIGDASTETVVAIAVMGDDSRSLFNAKISHNTFYIRDEVLDQMKDEGVFEFADWLVKSDRTDFQSTLLRGIHWLSSAQSQTQIENALLNIVACWETLFGAEKSEPITHTVSVGIALLTLTEVDERKHRRKQIAELYDKRSGLTHGRKIILTDNDVVEALVITRDLISVLRQLSGRFATRQEFRQWLDDRIMSANVEITPSF